MIVCFVCFYVVFFIGVVLVIMGLKLGVYVIIGFVGLLFDVLEFIVNLVLAIVVFWVLFLVVILVDFEYFFGYSKVEYFFSGLEGVFIFVVVFGIGYSVVECLLSF